MHRIILLRHLKNIRTIVEQVLARLEPLRPEDDAADVDDPSEYEGDHVI
jgi:hypothetical protein